MSKDLDRTQALHRELVGAIVQETGMREVLAVPIADSLMAYLQREYPGQKLYIPAPARQYDVLQIRASLERGDTPAEVCRSHALSRSTLYKMFPEGLPKPREEAA
jgi:Mor family transcriptional regulator